jgi:hypothetical protein
MVPPQNYGSKGRIVQAYINPHTGFMTYDVGLQVAHGNQELKLKEKMISYKLIKINYKFMKKFVINQVFFYSV